MIAKILSILSKVLLDGATINQITCLADGLEVYLPVIKLDQHEMIILVIADRSKLASLIHIAVT